MRVIVREWALRNGASDGATTDFIKQVRRTARRWWFVTTTGQ
jgi:hypothetical protein